MIGPPEKPFQGQTPQYFWPKIIVRHLLLCFSAKAMDPECPQLCIYFLGKKKVQKYQSIIVRLLRLCRYQNTAHAKESLALYFEKISIRLSFYCFCNVCLWEYSIIYLVVSGLCSL